MKRYVVAVFALTALILVTGSPSMAQDKKDKDKEKEKLGQYDEIIIRKKTDKDDKVTIEIKDGEVTINGKPIDEYDNENLSIRKRKTPVMGATSPFRRGGTLSFGDDNDMFGESGSSTRAFLGVTTDRTKDENGNSKKGGALIQSVSKNSGAEKAGLKKGDIITKIDDVVIEAPEDLTAEIRKRKPEEKVLITIKRDGKEQKVNATLGKTTSHSYSFSSPHTFSLPNMDGLRNFNFNWDGDNLEQFNVTGRGRLGIKAQDTEDEKGAKVLSVAEESAAAKAGIKADDVITEFNGENIQGADDLANAARESKEKPSVTVKLLRNGKQQTVEIKTPKKLKTANL